MVMSLVGTIGVAAATFGVAAGGVFAGLVLTSSGPFATADDAAEVAEASVTTIAGSGPIGVVPPALVDGAALAARFSDPTGIAVDKEGNLYVADFGNNAIRKIDTNGQVTTVAGGSKPGLRDGTATEALLYGPGAIAVDESGDIYFSEPVNHRIRRLTPDGVVETVAGSGPTGMGRGGFRDGPGADAQFNLPKGIAIAADGSIYVADTDNSRIRRIAPDRTVTTVAGGEQGFKDGPASEAQFSLPVGIAVGPDGSLYIADQPNGAIRKLEVDGTVTTIAKGLNFPAGVAVSPSGRVFVTDTSAHRVVEVLGDGSIIVIAGSGTAGWKDGTGLLAWFWGPAGIVADGTRLVVADSVNARIRQITGAGVR